MTVQYPSLYMLEEVGERLAIMFSRDRGRLRPVVGVGHGGLWRAFYGAR